MDKLKNDCKVKTNKQTKQTIPGEKKKKETKVALNPNYLNPMVQQPIALISQDFTSGFVFQENKEN